MHEMAQAGISPYGECSQKHHKHMINQTHHYAFYSLFHFLFLLHD
jgi:hypothetical protein